MPDGYTVDDIADIVCSDVVIVRFHNGEVYYGELYAVRLGDYDKSSIVTYLTDHEELSELNRNGDIAEIYYHAYDLYASMSDGYTYSVYPDGNKPW